MVVTEPSVSTDGRRRTSACTATMRRAPRASSTVTTAGSASGMAATARLMAVSAISRRRLAAQRRPPQKSRRRMPSTASARRLPKAARRSCSGVLRSPVSSSVATLPSSVRMPVATTSPRARPCVAVVPLKAMFGAVAQCAYGHRPPGLPVCLVTVTDSPVRPDSSTCSCAISIRRRSAGYLVARLQQRDVAGHQLLAGAAWASPARAARWRVPPPAGAARPWPGRRARPAQSRSRR